MSHFAKVIDGIVVDVIVAEKNFINSGAVGDEFLWVQTSYNKNFRGNYASIGGSYDKALDVFIPKKIFDSWVLDDSSTWIPPSSMPTDGKDYEWDEEVQDWVILDEQPVT